MQVPRLIATLLLLSSLAFAAEIAELRNGFTIRHRTREMHEGSVRLYIDDQKKSFVDLPAAEVTGFSSEPDPIASRQQSTTSPAKSTGQIVSEASVKHGVDSDFIQSVIKQESAGNAKAVSRSGARGLMQLMPGTASQLGVKDSFSPEQNVHGGARYLRELLERYNGDAVKTLAAYNAGPRAVARYNGVPPYRETQRYVQRVIREYNNSKRHTKTKTASTSRKHPALGGSAAK
ncbi:MAG: lytic transglycosylase domain-containing protein [Acidobacteria bacterium]|nr:MAG: lytic transglycosylase domain-containing protein [Acidobacteriota bacterium]